MQKTDVLVRLVGLLAGVVLLLWLLEFNIDAFRLFVINIYSPEKALETATLFLWRERFIDTVVQGMVVVAGLLGVLAYVLWGDRE